MAEFLVAARDLPSGYMRGDPIVVKDDDHVWGGEEGLPNFWQIRVKQVPASLVEPYIMPLEELAIIGDPEWDAPDMPDRKITRHRRGVRVMWDEVPQEWIDELDSTGRIELRKNQVRRYIRRLRWNRGQGKVEKTDQEII